MMSIQLLRFENYRFDTAQQRMDFKKQVLKKIKSEETKRGNSFTELEKKQLVDQDYLDLTLRSPNESKYQKALHDLEKNIKPFSLEKATRLQTARLQTGYNNILRHIKSSQLVWDPVKTTGKFPVELLIRIFQYLPKKSLHALRKTNKGFRHFINQEHFIEKAFLQNVFEDKTRLLNALHPAQLVPAKKSEILCQNTLLKNNEFQAFVANGGLEPEAITADLSDYKSQLAPFWKIFIDGYKPARTKFISINASKKDNPPKLHRNLLSQASASSLYSQKTMLEEEWDKAVDNFIKDYNENIVAKNRYNGAIQEKPCSRNDFEAHLDEHQRMVSENFQALTKARVRIDKPLLELLTKNPERISLLLDIVRHPIGSKLAQKSKEGLKKLLCLFGEGNTIPVYKAYITKILNGIEKYSKETNIDAIQKFINTPSFLYRFRSLHYASYGEPSPKEIQDKLAKMFPKPFKA